MKDNKGTEKAANGFFRAFFNAVISAFGQIEKGAQKSCPSTGLIRTSREENREKVFELRLYSDRSRGESGKVVRTQSLFGQEEGGTQKSCPNSVSIRTRRRENLEKLSELSLYSDKSGGESGKVVRTQSLFGQVGRRIGKSCPNSVPIRTG
jgi:hypothetical protein